MCPLCITTAAVLSAAGATSGAGAAVVAATRWRAVKRWFGRGRDALMGQKRYS
jgi:hypothetical protein